jgi:23S rRNA-/tRNA-specific pseudouridylate synthase
MPSAARGCCTTEKLQHWMNGQTILKIAKSALKFRFISRYSSISSQFVVAGAMSEISNHALSCPAEPILSKTARKKLHRIQYKASLTQKKLQQANSAEEKPENSSQSNKKFKQSAKSQEPSAEAGLGCNYIISGGLRHVQPYFFDYLVYCKQRWFGRPLLTVLKQEFKHAEGENYYLRALNSGTITVNSAPADPNYLLRNADLLKHSVHKHEPPISAENVQIVANTEELLVVSKPSSMPIHSCGVYWHNSLLAVLLKEYGKLFPIHRLDRLTSGLVLLAKNNAAANSLALKMQQKLLQKTYFARVMGKFPLTSELQELKKNNTTANIVITRSESKSNGKIQTDNSNRDDYILISAPIVCTSKQVASHTVDYNLGKSAETLVRRLHYDGYTSLVECKPITGRTHQIRVHLQHFGYPIANDSVYGGRLYQSNAYQCNSHPDPGVIQQDCSHCLRTSYYDNTVHPLSIWLHAYSYSCNDFHFKTPLPPWAAEDFNSKEALTSPIQGYESNSKARLEKIQQNYEEDD